MAGTPIEIEKDAVKGCVCVCAFRTQPMSVENRDGLDDDDDLRIRNKSSS